MKKNYFFVVDLSAKWFLSMICCYSNKRQKFHPLKFCCAGNVCFNPSLSLSSSSAADCLCSTDWTELYPVCQGRGLGGTQEVSLPSLQGRNSRVLFPSLCQHRSGEAAIFQLKIFFHELIILYNCCWVWVFKSNLPMVV